jgi:hypothetical protein
MLIWVEFWLAVEAWEAALDALHMENHAAKVLMKMIFPRSLLGLLKQSRM